MPCLLRFSNWLAATIDCSNKIPRIRRCSSSKLLMEGSVASALGYIIVRWVFRFQKGCNGSGSVRTPSTINSSGRWAQQTAAPDEKIAVLARRGFGPFSGSTSSMLGAVQPHEQNGNQNRGGDTRRYYESTLFPDLNKTRLTDSPMVTQQSHCGVTKPRFGVSQCLRNR